MKSIPLILLAATLLGSSAPIQDIPWHYTLEKPGDQWSQTSFDDSNWPEGYAGFGNRTTPGSRVSTDWKSSNIWLRQEVVLEALPAEPALYIFHDEDAVVYINGKIAATFKGFVTEYQLTPLSKEATSLLRKGKNLIAVQCEQVTGGQAIDVHLVDGKAAPELSPARLPKYPFKTELMTEWGSKVTPQNAWREYPRPALVRKEWTNLNGQWDYTIVDGAAGKPSDWAGKILVPFSVESKLSGVQQLLHPGQALWYRRSLDLQQKEGRRTILNFEAVDYEMTAWVNGQEVGTHVGGNLPFSFDVTDALKKEGVGELVVRVEDGTGDYQLKGKQVLHPHGIWYTPVSGIWQTVWAEDVPADHIESLTVSTKIDGTVTVKVNGSDGPAEVKLNLAGKEVAKGSGKGTITLKVTDPQLWSPDSPTLYDLVVTTGEDRVESYVGIREVGKSRDAEGHLRFTLNGKPIFHWGPLDQGWWPDGLLTPPSDEGMVFDIQYLKEAGFNMIRKHIKVEPRRYYTHCDRIGMLVWQDQVSGGESPRWIHLEANPKDAEWPDAAHSQYMKELDGMMTALENHPSIVVWVPFNEAWGQHRTVAVGEWTVDRDPTRHVNIASGGNFWPVGDVVDRHRYPHPGFPFDRSRFVDFIKVVGEFGGHGLPVKDHLWNTEANNWGYGGLPKNSAEYKERYVESLRILKELKGKGVAGAVYTQTTDVEGEINGLMTYDRKVIKVPASELKDLHQGLVD
ncbi:MAG: glycoside hydrolase family 2 TIM barrel-domain containing protein [Akkermansiaceae bacterium]